MSNIGKKPVKIKEGVTVQLEGTQIKVTGPKGMLEAKLPPTVVVTIEDGKVIVKKEDAQSSFENYFGLTRSLIANLVKGVSDGFERKLELVGVGYRAKIEGKDLVLNVGYANPVRIKPLEGITIAVGEGNVISVTGINKQFVGDIASKIRAVRPPDPYKAKGIRYQGEHIRRKAGKAGKAA